MEWMISPEGSSDCVLVQHNSEDMIVEDSIQVVQLKSDTQEEKRQKVNNVNKNKRKTYRQDGIDLWLDPAGKRVSVEVPKAPLDRTGQG